MARIALLSPDLLFGSKVEGALALAGHEVNRFATAERLRVAAQFHDLVIVDLTAEGIDGPELLHALREHGELEEGTPTLGYYSHVDVKALSLSDSSEIVGRPASRARTGSVQPPRRKRRGAGRPARAAAASARSSSAAP